MDKKRTPFFSEKKYIFYLIGLISLFILLIGYFIYSSETNSLLQEKHNEINAIADLKGHQIVQWRGERLSEARFFSTNELFIKNTKDLLLKNDTTRLHKYFYSTLSPIQKSHNYENIYIINPQKEIRFSLDGGLVASDSSLNDDILTAIDKKEIVFADLHLTQSKEIFLDIIAPILDQDNKVIALLIFQINPYDYLYPLIESWPTPSKTSETFIFRKENDSAVFLSNLRLENFPPLTLRLPLTMDYLPVIKALKGDLGLFDGKDYRGVKVVAVSDKLEGTPWYMMAKIDQKEIYSELNFRAVIIAILTIVLVLLSGLGIFFIYTSNQRRIYKRYSAALEENVKERTAELSLAHSELEYANKELEAFSYSVSHDLRAPLRAIIGFSNLLKDDLCRNCNSESKDVINDIIETTSRMEILINDLLQFSRLNKKEMNKDYIDMNSLFKNCFSELISQMPKKNYNFIMENLPNAFGDYHLIKQVVINYLSNAIKFTEKKENPEIKISGTVNDIEFVYKISDNGVGFNMEYSDKLFKVFQRLHAQKDFEGTGVGLAIVQRIVARHGGNVWAEGEVNKGANFYFSLPLNNS